MNTYICYYHSYYDSAAIIAIIRLLSISIIVSYSLCMTARGWEGSSGASIIAVEIGVSREYLQLCRTQVPLVSKSAHTN